MEKIKLPSPAFLEPYQSGRKLAVTAGNVISCLMMVSIALSFFFLGINIFPGWKGTYLVWLALFLSIESIYTRRRVREFEQKEKIFFRVSEWIAFAVLIKLVIYLVNDPAQILRDIPLWQADFLLNFFTGEYLMALFVAVVTWWSSAAYSGEIEDLYEREEDAEWDDLGKLQNELRLKRNRIASRVFFLGTLVVGLTVLSRMDFETLLEGSTPLRSSIAPIGNVLVYFLLALILLTQTQFAVLRMRWITQRLPISPRLAKNWVRFSLAFFVVLGAVVALLPTHYSIGLLDTLRYTLGFLSRVVTFFFALIALPITFCLSLFKVSTAPTSNTTTMAPGAFTAAPPPQSPAWWDFVRSFAFWLFFTGVIIFALRYYLMQNTAVWKAIRAFPLLKWVSELWAGLRSWFKGANRQISEMVNAGWKRIRAQRINLPIAPIRRLLNLSRMNTREKIIFYYLNLVELGGERGLERRPSQTPNAYRSLLSRTLPEVEDELSGLTETFNEARYSRHPMDESIASQAGSFWDRIKAVLRSWQKPNGR